MDKGRYKDMQELAQMNSENGLEVEPLESQLQAVADTVRYLAQSHQGDCLALLSILRMLESLHADVRDTWFQPALPDNRQALYNLLRDIEASGGWPYIYRMRLHELLKNFQGDLTVEPPVDSNPHQSA
ncbi:hypothetical protein ACN4EK_07905 [Pantanalinema rosaneae CENA516]|uniref:hypothetical protein n=1 Tax=Pantanalinema rosaneae TaxID=1620701 RepID=UPI003D6E4286